MSTTQAAAPAEQAEPKALTKRRGFAKLRLHLSNIYRLVIKELRSFRSDPIMLLLVAYSFTIAIHAAATGASTEATNLSVGIVDEDHSSLSRGIADGLTPPTFRHVIQLTPTEIDAAMNAQRVLFVIEIPTSFESDILAGRQPTVEIDIDATAAAQASSTAARNLTRMALPTKRPIIAPPQYRLTSLPPCCSVTPRTSFWCSRFVIALPIDTSAPT